MVENVSDPPSNAQYTTVTTMAMALLSEGLGTREMELTERCNGRIEQHMQVLQEPWPPLKRIAHSRLHAAPLPQRPCIGIGLHSRREHVRADADIGQVGEVREVSAIGISIRSQLARRDARFSTVCPDSLPYQRREECGEGEDGEQEP